MPDLPEDLFCPEEIPCTDLLIDPIGVLNDNKRWPKHLCAVRFLLISTVEWASSTGIALSTPKLERWRWTQPLPIGKKSAASALKTYNEVLFNIVPFQEREEALWALRIDDNDCRLDLFGLAIPHGHSYTIGGLKYVLRGQGTRLFDLVPRAEKWWDRFRGEAARGGRPLGSGTWRSADDFETNLQIAVRSLRAQGRRVTQEEAAKMLHTNDRQLREWLKRYGVKWKRISETT